MSSNKGIATSYRNHRHYKTWLDVCTDWLLHFTYPYQRDWILRETPLEIDLKGRQIGWSFSIAARAVLRAMLLGIDQMVVSSSERQSREVMTKALKIARFLTSESIFAQFPLPAKIVEPTSAAELKFTDGAKIVSLPQNPGTVRGFTGDVYLDEFAHFRLDAETYVSAFPITTLGYSLRIVSTPLGKSGRFYDIWAHEKKYPSYLRIKVDILDAMRMGLKVDVKGIRQGLGDEEAFNQEYLCQFVDELAAFMGYDLIRSCIGDEPTNVGMPLLGIDVGRHQDRTVFYIANKVEGKYFFKRMQVMHRAKFSEQREMAEQIIRDEGIQRGAIDATGLGEQFAEELCEQYPFIEPVTFNTEVKALLAQNVKKQFENRNCQIPDDPRLITDIHAIKKSVTPTGNFRYDAERNEEGHADRFWALALAYYSGLERTNDLPIRISSGGQRVTSSILQNYN